MPFSQLISSAISLLSETFSDFSSPPLHLSCFFFFFLALYSVNFVISSITFSASLSVGSYQGSIPCSVLLSHELSLVDRSTSCSQLLLLVNGSHPWVSTPNICLEKYSLFNGVMYLSCKVLQMKDVQSWLTEMEDRNLLFLYYKHFRPIPLPQYEEITKKGKGFQM